MDQSTRRRTTDALASAMRDRFFVAPEPDLPGLLLGPDLLATQTGRTIAAFVPSNRELADRRHLHARLLLCRLALPPETVTLLILPADRPVADSKQEPAFTMTVSASDLSHEMVDAIPSKPLSAIPIEVRAWNQQRAALLLEFAKDPSRAHRLFRSKAHRALQLPEERTVTLSLLQQMGLPARAEVHVEQRVVVAYARPSAHSIRQALDPLLPATLLAAFDVHGEEVRLASHLAGLLSILSTDKSHDTRALRKAAFAGWAIFTDSMPTDSVDLLNSWLQG